MTIKAALAMLAPYFGADEAPTMELLVRWEGLRTAVYADAAGNPTIGVGHKLPPGVELGSLRWSPSHIASVLEDDIQAARSRYPALDLTPKQRAALTSLAFNVGDLRGTRLARLLEDYVAAGGYRVGPADLVDVHDLGVEVGVGGRFADIQEVVREWVTWDHAHLSGGDLQVSRGLLLRRLAEATLFVEGAGDER